MGSTNKIINGAIWTTLMNVLNALYGFIAIPILINFFGKEQYGLIGLAMSINVYMNLMDMGFNSTNVRFFSSWLAENKIEKVKRAFKTSLFFYGSIGLLNALLLILLSFFSGRIFNITEEQLVILNHLLYILAGSAFCSWFSSCFEQLVKSTEEIAWIQKVTIGSKLLMLAVLILTICCNFSIEIYFVLTCLAALLIVPLSINKIKRELPFISFLPKLDKETFKEMLPYSLNIFSFSIFQFSFYNLRPVLLGIQGTVESVADYKVLNGIIGVVTLLGGTFVGILLPSTSKLLAEHNTEAFNRVAYDGTKYISILISFCCFGMMTVGTEVITMYVGTSYLYLIPWFNVWLLCTLGTHNQAISSLILAGSDIRAISYSSVAASLLGLLSCWFLIPSYGIGGTVVSFVIYIIIQIGFYYLYYWPRVMHLNSWRIFYQDFIPYVLLGVLVYYVTNSTVTLLHNVILSFFVKGGCFVALFILGLFILTNKSDKNFILQVLKLKKT